MSINQPPLRSSERFVIFLALALLAFGVAGGYFKSVDVGENVLDTNTQVLRIVESQNREADARAAETVEARKRNQEFQRAQIEAADTAKEVLERIEECTTPDTECTNRAKGDSESQLAFFGKYLACINLDLQGYQIPGHPSNERQQLYNLCQPVLGAGGTAGLLQR